MRPFGGRGSRPAAVLMPLVALATLATLAAAPPAGQTAGEQARSGQPGVVVVVNPSNPVGTLSRDEVSRLFLRKVSRWPNGVPVFPVDQRRDASVRVAFSQAVHRRSVDMLTLYWQRQVFSGRQVPPPEDDGDTEVLAFVRATPGAIGYVSSDADVRSVKVVPISPD
jgi:ABC-type phosphate transport system substrate-binding protein